MQINLHISKKSSNFAASICNGTIMSYMQMAQLEFDMPILHHKYAYN